MVHITPFGGYIDTLGIIPRKDEWFVKVDPYFVLNWCNMLGPKWLIEDPHQRMYVVDFNMDTLNPWLLQGWGEIVQFYGLDNTYWCLMGMAAPSHFHMQIFDKFDVEISYDPIITYVEGSASATEEEDDGDSVRIDSSDEEALANALALVPYEPPPPNTDHTYELGVVPFAPGPSNLNAIWDLGAGMEVVSDVATSSVQTLLPSLEYRMHLHTTLTPYRAYGSQYTLPRRLAQYVRQHGRKPWIIRGPTGITKDINILYRPNRSYVKLGRGWRKFCKLHDIQHGQRIAMHFSDGVSRVIDVELFK